MNKFKKFHKNNRGAAPVLVAVVIAGAGMLALMQMNKIVTFNAQIAVHLSIRTLVQQTTRASIQTMDQMLLSNNGINEEPGEPYFLMDEEAGTLALNGALTLPQYIADHYTETPEPTFSFVHCDVRNGEFRMAKYMLNSEFDENDPCHHKINTTIKIKKISDEGIIVAAESKSTRPQLSTFKYRLAAKLVRFSCDFGDKTDRTTLAADTTMILDHQQCHGKNINLDTNRYVGTDTYDDVNDTINFIFWTHHEENQHHNCSTYRWDQFYNAYPDFVGNVDTHPAGVTYTGPNQYFSGVSGFVRGKWIWDGGWSIKHTVSITNATSGECALAVVSSWGNPTGDRNGGCFTPETRLTLVNGDSVPIKDLTIGYQLLNPITKQPVTVRSLVAGPEKAPMFRINVDNRTVEVTQTHPFLTPTGLQQAQHLSDGDLVFCEDKLYCPVEVTVVPPNPDQIVYNLVVSTDSKDPYDHFVLADGVVTGDLYLQQQLEWKALGRLQGLSLAEQEFERQRKEATPKLAQEKSTIEYEDDEWELEVY